MSHAVFYKMESDISTMTNYTVYSTASIGIDIWQTLHRGEPEINSK